MTDDEGPVTWSSIAGWYDDLLTSGSGPHGLATQTLLTLVPDAAAGFVLDIACGQGVATRAIAEAGAQEVVGVDITPELIAIARERETAAPLGIAYRLDDAQRLTTVENGSADGVTCQLGLMDVPDLDACLSAVRRVLRSDGWFTFVIGHPCFLAPDAETQQDGDGHWGRFVSDYFDERFWRSKNPSGVRRVGNYHRTVSTYINALTRAELVLDVLIEPPADALLAEQQPVYRNVPIFLAGRARPA